MLRNWSRQDEFQGSNCGKAYLIKLCLAITKTQRFIAYEMLNQIQLHFSSVTPWEELWQNQDQTLRPKV